MKVILNGNIIDESEVNLGINNRGFNYGDGLFETIIGDDNNIKFLKDHLSRLSSGLIALGMEPPHSLRFQTVSEYVTKLRKENGINGFGRIKIIAWRKSGGLFSPISKDVEYLITIIPANINSTPKQQAIFYDKIRLCYSPISKFKKVSAITYVMAGIFMKESAADEVILLDTEGHIGECLASNIFWIKNNIVFTPSLDTGCLEGIMRKQIIKYLKENKIELIEGKFKKDELINADFVFSSNATGVVILKNIDGKIYQENSTLFEKISKAVEY